MAAGVVELVDALGSGPSFLREVGVRVPPPAHLKLPSFPYFQEYKSVIPVFILLL